MTAARFIRSRSGRPIVGFTGNPTAPPEAGEKKYDETELPLDRPEGSEDFPIPVHKPIQEHFSERRPWWRTILDRLQHRPPQSFYQKRQSEQIAAYLTLADIAGTDLAPIIEELKTMGAQARQY